MIQYKPGDSWSVQFTTTDLSGAATNADSTPTVTVYRNGTSDNSNWSLSAVSNPATGQYRVTGTVFASASPGDLIEVKAEATIGGTAAIGFVERFRLVQWPVTALPNAASGSAGAVLTAGTGTGQLSVTGGVGSANLTQVTGNAVPATSVNGVPKVDVAYANGVAVQNNDGVAQAGGSTTITLAASSSSTNNIVNGRKITIIGGTGAGQSAVILSYVGSTKVATVDRTWTTTPDSTSEYVIGDTANARLSQAEQDALINELLDLANTMESGETLRQTLRLIRSVLVGVSTETTGTVVFKRRDGTTTALTVVHDATGSRSSSTVGTV